MYLFGPNVNAIETCNIPEQNITTVKSSSQSDIVKPMVIQIIVGSVRKTSTGDKIGKIIKSMADKRPEISTEILKVTDFNIPTYVDETNPASRESEITDPILKRWSDKIKEADGYIIIAPEYNSGYPGPLKNAIDSLYKEWNNKPVALVGYSGGPSGGTSMLEQLRQVLSKGLKMIPVATEIKIPSSWKAFNLQGDLIQPNIEQNLNSMIDQLLAAKVTKK
ncbi:MAG TPA: NAD(P)H-dependent oxidoreductase [Candidatus Babeliaceae bacterium]|nr:NAD(P)H-dependent oxidoreductase [Candidatus Babeliaceae bacterium]